MSARHWPAADKISGINNCQLRSDKENKCFIWKQPLTWCIRLNESSWLILVWWVTSWANYRQRPSKSCELMSTRNVARDKNQSKVFAKAEFQVKSRRQRYDRRDSWSATNGLATNHTGVRRYGASETKVAAGSATVIVAMGKVSLLMATPANRCFEHPSDRTFLLHVVTQILRRTKADQTYFCFR